MTLDTPKFTGGVEEEYGLIDHASSDFAAT